MDSMNEREQKRDRTNRDELVERLATVVRQDGVVEALPGLHVSRASEPTERVYGVTIPSLCVIAQGAKELNIGGARYRYDSERYMLATAELPVTGRVVEASRERPYLAFKLELEPALVGSVMVEAAQLPGSRTDSKAVVVSALGSGLLDAVVRLVRLLDAPSERAALMPLVKREIVFRLLMGEQGGRLRELPMLGGQSDHIAKAVDRLRRQYDQPLRIDSLAKELGMSSSGFHHHFKTVTDMSPLQFQKQLRLQEARRLMLGENLDAASAGYRVGYDDPSHFSRDYKRHFGNSPVRDVARLRSMVSAD